MTEMDWFVLDDILSEAMRNKKVVEKLTEYYTRDELNTARKALKRLQKATGL